MIEAILIGGPRDGERVGIPERWPRIVLQVAPAFDWWRTPDLDAELVLPRTIVYERDAHDGPGTATDYLYAGTF